MNNNLIIMHLLRMVFLGFCYSSLCWSATLFATEVRSNQSKVPVFKIQVNDASSQKIGLEIGRQSKIMFPDIEHRYDAHLAKTLTQTQFKHILQHRLPHLLEQVDTRYQKEMQGVMSAWSIIQTNILGDGFLSIDEYLILNLLSDIELVPNGSGFGAFGAATQDGKPLLGRNMDWKSTSELRSLQAITVYYYADKQIVNIGFSGIISILTGFNHHGLFLSYMNAEPYSPYTEVYNPQVSRKTSKTIFAVREILENHQNIKQAKHFLSKATFNSNNNLLIADKDSVQVFELSTQHRMEIRHWDSQTHDNKKWDAKQQIAVVDCHILAALPNHCNDSKDTYRWQRFRKLATFNEQRPLKKRQLATLLFDSNNDRYEIFNAETINSVIFQPENNALYLYTATIHTKNTINPVHLAYLDLLRPSELSYSKIHITLWQIMWIIILLLIIFITVWIYELPKKMLRKRKN